MWLDQLPAGRRKKGASDSQIRRLIRGGQIADSVHARERMYHEMQELPEAEKGIDEALSDWPEKDGPSVPTVAEEMHRPVRTSFWSKLFPFFSNRS